MFLRRFALSMITLSALVLAGCGDEEGGDDPDDCVCGAFISCETDDTCGTGEVCVDLPGPCGCGAVRCDPLDCSGVVCEPGCEEGSCEEGFSCVTTPVSGECCAVATCTADDPCACPPSATCQQDPNQCGVGRLCEDVVSSGDDCACVSASCVDNPECDDLVCGRSQTCEELDCAAGTVCQTPDAEPGACCEPIAACVPDPDCADVDCAPPESCEDTLCGLGEICEESSTMCCGPAAECVPNPDCELVSCADPTLTCATLRCESGTRCVEPAAAPGACCAENAVCEPIEVAVCFTAPAEFTPCDPEDADACGDGLRCGEERYTPRPCPGPAPTCAETPCEGGLVCVERDEGCGPAGRCVPDCREVGCGGGETCGADGVCEQPACEGAACQCVCDEERCTRRPAVCLASEE